ncbi:HesA/MoeB/ThiF family protein [Erwiniaceae bacterium BAC15a-03b]|uniref:HesA/MoeB/ThiF family protein n=1 Tax=Winslowiella arboricola TaxID=2978220 RepID=A0A9J6PXT5_9GAMM|nr:HesA/MoeB/ThiF family protein [Winslowiella arboricola]MCU5775323.1 HesA/MoeB/ThiF family protein [Winslowiella arboricola]MCU5780280.1 HesA/MoeB/ThiF family protein [Winslowiella arboricola]
MTRYQRQTMLPEIGAQGQQRLAQARVLVVGAGGLGCSLLPLLAGAGVGYLRIYDADQVAVHNLHRQTLYSMDDIQLPKVLCASRALQQLNPECQVDAVQQRLSLHNLAEALTDIDLVIDAADNFAVTYQLSDACQPRAIPLISASVLGLRGYVGGFCASAPSYRAIFPSLPATAANCNTAGVMGPAVATLGAIQAQMALSILLDLSPSPLGCMVNCDFARWHFSQFRFDGAPEPVGPQTPFIDAQRLTAEDCVVELRGTEEAPQSVAGHAIRLLPQQIADWQPPADQRIVLVCASGIRAARAAAELEQRGYLRLAILAAG